MTEVVIGSAYRITRAGEKALRAKKSIPVWYRVVLTQIAKGGDVSVLHSRTMRRHPPRRVRAWLEEMETLGFIEAATAGTYLVAKYGQYRERLPELQPIIDKIKALSA